MYINERLAENMTFPLSLPLVLLSYHEDITAKWNYVRREITTRSRTNLAVVTHGT